MGKTKIFAIVISVLCAIVAAGIAAFIFFVPKPEQYKVEFYGDASIVAYLYGDGEYKKGDEVTLIAQEKPGHSFESWLKEDVVVSYEQTYVFIMNEQTRGKYTATYLPKGFSITAVQRHGQFNVTQDAKVGDNVQITEVVADPGYQQSEMYYIIEGKDQKVEIKNNSFVMPVGNISVYVEFEPITYTIEYIYEQDVEIGELVSEYNVETDTFTLPIPVRTGYVFDGWTGTDQQEPKVSVMIEKGSIGNRQYTANWQKQLYNITTVDSIGGTISVVQEAYYQDQVEVNISSDTGYLLTALYYVLPGDDDQYDIDLTFEMPAGNITIYAIFEQVLYTVAKDPNATNCVISLSRLGANLGDQVVVTVATDEGYEVIRTWYVLEGTSSEVEFTHNFTMPSGNVTVYADVQPISYMITYVLDGGTLPQDAKTSYYVWESFLLPIPTLEGHVFENWNINIGGDVTSISEIETGTTGDITLYAVWQKETYLIEFVNEDGLLLFADYFEFGTTPTYNNSTPTKASTNTHHYTFIGWSPELYPANKAQVYTAQFAAVERLYTVQFNANGGSSVASEEYKYGETLSNLSSKVTTRQGYNFIGWFTALTGGFEVSSQTQVLQNVTYHARWSAVSYSITLVLDGGTVGGNNPIGYTIQDNDFTLPTPTKEGYTFLGWQLQGSDSTEPTVTIQKGSYGDKTYTAKWQAKTFTIVWKNYDGAVLETDTVEYDTMPTYDGETPTKPADQEFSYIFSSWTPAVSKATQNTEYIATFTATTMAYAVDFDSNGGESVASISKDYGDTIGTLPTPTRDGYTLYGWFTQAIGGTQVTEDYIVTKSITLYARWDTVTYSITYNLDGGSISGQAISYNIETPTFTLPTPTKEAHDFAGWTGTDLSQATMTVTISKGSIGHKTYTATWTKTVYNITTASFVNGSVDVVNSATKGDNVLVTITPDTGYKVDEQYYLISGDETQYEFINSITMPAQDIQICVTFVKELYTIEVDAIQNGQVTTSKATAYYGDEINITTAPDDKYRLGSVWYQDYQGNNQTAITDNKFTMPAFSIYVCAEFIGPYYALTVLEEPYDIDITIVDESGNTLAVQGETIQLIEGTPFKTIVTLNQEGIEIKEVILQYGEVVAWGSIDGSKVCYMPASITAIIVEYDHITYDIDTQCNNGTLTVASSAKFDTEVEVTVTPDIGYNLSALYYVRESDNQRVDIEGTSFIMPASDIRVYAEFSNRAYTITKIDSTNGDFTISKTTANYNEEITLTITPAAGYSYFEAYYQTSTDSVSINGNKFTMPADDVLVVVVFAKIQYTITIPEFDEFDINIQEKLDGAGDPWYVGEGSDISLEWGQIGVVTLNSEFAAQYDTASSYIYYYDPTNPTVETKIVDNTFTMPQHNVVIGAHLVAKSYTFVFDVAYNVGDVYLVDEGGNVISTCLQENGSFEDRISMPYNTKLKWVSGDVMLGFRYTNTVLVYNGNGEDVAEDTFFTMPACDVILYVNWEEIQYNITTEVSGEGTVNIPSLGCYNNPAYISIAPSTGYYIREIYYIIDGQTDKNQIEYYGGQEDYFIMPASDITVYVVFELITDFTVGGYEYQALDTTTARVITFTNSTATTTTVPDSVDYQGTTFTIVELTDGVFDGKTNLTTVNIGKNITTISYAQFNGSGVTTVNIADDNPKYTDLDMNAIFTKDTLVLISACNGTIADGSKSYNSVGSYAFRGVYNGDVVLPSGLTYIGEYAFDNSGLTTITLPESLNSISGYAFNSADNLDTIVLPGNVVLQENALAGWNGTVCVKNSATYNSALKDDPTTESNFDHLTGVYVLRSIDKGTSTYFNNTTKYPYVYPKVTVGESVYNSVYNLYSTAEQDVANFFVTVNDSSLGEASWEGGYYLGNTVTISAHTYDNNFFLGWKLNAEDENYVSTDIEYSFTVTNNGATGYCAIFAQGYDLNFIYMSEGITSVEVTVGQDTYIESSNFGISVQAKTNVYILACVTDGYTISMIDIEFSGSSYEQFYTSNAEFIMPEMSLNICIYADKEVYVYSTNITGQGEVEISSNNGEGSAEYESDVVVTATPAAGYNLSKTYYICENDSQQTQYEFIEKFTMPADDVTIYVVFEAVFAVFSNDLTLGTVASSGTFAVGNNVSVAATPIGTNVFLGWKTSLDATTYISTNQEYTFTVTASSPAHYYGIFVAASSESTIGDYTYTFNNTAKTATVKKFNNTTATTTTVPQTVVENNITYTVTEIGYGAYMSNWTIDYITLPSTITKIDSSAFGNCRGLQSINLPEGLIEIGSGAFDICYSLDELILPTSLQKIGDDAFRSTSLDSMHIPKNVSSIGRGIFSYSYSTLKTVTVDSENSYYEDRGLNAIIQTSNNALIAACPGTTLDNTVKIIGSKAFFSIDMSSINIPSSVESIGSQAFYNAQIPEIILNAGLVTISSDAFANNTKITSITIPSTVTSCSVDFIANNTALKTIYVKSSAIYPIFTKDNFTHTDLSETISCFDILENIYILSSIDDGSNTYLSNTTNYPYQYKNVSVNGVAYNLYSKVENTDIEYLLTVESNDLTLGTAAYSGTAKVGNNITLAATPIGDNIFLGWKNSLSDTTYISTSQEYSFTFATSSSRIYYAEFMASTSNYTEGDYTYTLNHIDNTATVKSFSNQTATTATIKQTVNYNNNNYTVTSIGAGAFQYKTALESVSLPNTITRIENSGFNHLVNLSSVELSESLEYIGPYGFQYAGSNTSFSVVLPNSLKEIASQSFYNSGLKEIYIPKNLTSIGHGAFSACSSLETIIVDSANIIYEDRGINAIVEIAPNRLIAATPYTLFDNSIAIIGEWSCMGISLKNFTVPESVTSIEWNAFFGSEVETMTLNEGLLELGSQCFGYSENLKEINIPSTITNYYKDFIRNCPSLESIYVDSQKFYKEFTYDYYSDGYHYETDTTLLENLDNIYVLASVDDSSNAYLKSTTNYPYQYTNVYVNGKTYNLYAKAEHTDIVYDGEILAYSNDDSLGETTGSGMYDVGETVTLSACGTSGYFYGWAVDSVDGGLVSKDTEYTFVVEEDSPKVYYALFYTYETIFEESTEDGWKLTYYLYVGIERACLVSAFDTSEVSLLTELRIPDSISYDGDTYIVDSCQGNIFGNYAFNGDIYIGSNLTMFTLQNGYGMVANYYVSSTNPLLRTDSSNTAIYSKNGKKIYAASCNTTSIEEGVETIGECAFYCLTTSVTIPSSVKDIERYAFYCGGNERGISLTFDDDVEIESLGYGALYGCVLNQFVGGENLTIIPVYSLNCYGSSEIDLSKCVNLQKIDSVAIYGQSSTILKLPAHICEITLGTEAINGVTIEELHLDPDKTRDWALPAFGGYGYIDKLYIYTYGDFDSLNYDDLFGIEQNVHNLYVLPEADYPDCDYAALYEYKDTVVIDGTTFYHYHN